MTVLDVKEAVLGYGFATDLEENDSLFYTSLNYAVQEVNRIRPRTSSVVIVHEPVAPVYALPDVTLCVPGEELAYSCVARSAVCEVTGHGSLIVEGATVDGNDRAVWNVDGGWVRLTAVSNSLDEIKLVFSGDTTFHIRNVAFYDTAFPPSVVITGADAVDYDLAKFAPDFASVEFPIIKDGVAMLASDPRMMLLHGNVLRVPKDEHGTYEVVYNVSPRRFGIGDDDKDIPLDSDLAELLPLLVASYVWQEDDASRAMMYYTRFAEAKRGIPKRKRVDQIIDRKGWS